MSKMNKPSTAFLKDVFICSLGAYGGPEAHYGVFTDQLVVKKNYLTEDELVELIALCTILPGPTSTQTIVAIGYKIGGPWLAFLTMMVWAMPVLTAMTALSFVYQLLHARNISTDSLRYIGPMAVAFIAVAAYRIGKKVAVDPLTWTLLIAGAVITYWIRAPWVFPLVLIAGGAAAISASKEKELWNTAKISPPWGYLLAFGGIALGSFLISITTNHPLLTLFESFYRYGYLVFGGGQVVVPVMYSELVQIHQYMSSSEFLTGYGMVQGLPGPMFSFSAYAGGLAARGHGAMYQLVGAVAGGVGIFLPGLLLIYFVYPVWESLKKIRGIKVALKGINAVAGGLLATSAVVLLQKNGMSGINLTVTLVSAALLLSRKLPAPILVFGALAAGFFLNF